MSSEHPTLAEHRAASLVEQRAALEKATEDRISALLKEREDIDVAHKQRHAEIATELKALGYKRPRVIKAKD